MRKRKEKEKIDRFQSERKKKRKRNFAIRWCIRSTWIQKCQCPTNSIQEKFQERGKREKDRFGGASEAVEKDIKVKDKKVS